MNFANVMFFKSHIILIITSSIVIFKMVNTKIFDSIIEGDLPRFLKVKWYNMLQKDRRQSN